MKKALLTAIAVCTAAAVHADTIDMYTPPFGNIGGGRVMCQIVNVSQKARDVSLQIINANVGFTGVTPVTPKTLAPGQSTMIQMQDSCTDGGCGPWFCKFTVDTAPVHYRAMGCGDMTFTLAPYSSSVVTVAYACIPAQ